MRDLNGLGIAGVDQWPLAARARQIAMFSQKARICARKDALPYQLLARRCHKATVGAAWFML